MGNRFLDERLKGYISFTQTWGNKEGIGRYWKRILSKARRRYAKAELRGERGKEPVGLESTVNWKSW